MPPAILRSCSEVYFGEFQGTSVPTVLPGWFPGALCAGFDHPSGWLQHQIAGVGRFRTPKSKWFQMVHSRKKILYRMGRSRVPYKLDFPGLFCSDLRVEIPHFVVNQL